MTANERTDLGLKESGAGCACCALPETETETAAEVSTPTHEVLVEGMTCGHCVSSVTEELASIDGVEGVDVDLNAGGLSRVAIRSSAPVDRSAIDAAVRAAGYTPAG